MRSTGPVRRALPPEPVPVAVFDTQVAVVGEIVFRVQRCSVIPNSVDVFVESRDPRSPGGLPYWGKVPIACAATPLDAMFQAIRQVVRREVENWLDDH